MEELREALRTINEQVFPERAAKIRERIKYYENAKSILQAEAQSIVNNSDASEQKLDLQKYLKYFSKAAPLLYLVSLLFGISALFAFLAGNYLVPGFGYQITLQFPGLQKLEFDTLKGVSYFLIITINSCFVISAIGSYFNNSFLMVLLALCWGFLSIGVQLWKFQWWPTAHFDFPISGTFNLFELELGFKLN
ncbi:hypothetical protein L0244_28740, partial [bacterium]|nr:hypothetical protein [bacterium]